MIFLLFSLQVTLYAFMLLMLLTVSAELHSDPWWGDPILWQATEKYNGFLLHGENNWKFHLEGRELNLNVFKDHSHLFY